MNRPVFPPRPPHTFATRPSMSGNVRFCPVLSTLSPLSPSTPCNQTTYNNFPHTADRTYQTFAPQQLFFASSSRSSRLVSLVRPKAASSVFSAFYPNVRKCPVLSGLLNAIPVITINPMYQHDLQQFTSCLRPDIPDILSPQEGAAPTPRCRRLRWRVWVPEMSRLGPRIDL